MSVKAGQAHADGWEPRGMRELNASDDKDEFIFDPPDTADLWPVYKGESFDLWQPDTGTVYAWAEPEHITEVLERRRANQVRNRRSSFFGMLQWQRDPATLPAQHPRIAWRDSSRARDSRTVRAALVPPNTILVHQAYTIFFRRGDACDEAWLLGVLCSMPFDWFARQFVESHVTVEFLTSTPVPARDRDSGLQRRVQQIAGRLAAVDERYRAWAEAVGVPVASVSDDERLDLLAELDSAVALLYGLTQSDVRLIYDTFHEGADYSQRRDAVMAHMRSLR
jgi:hypothetical protein